MRPGGQAQARFRVVDAPSGKSRAAHAYCETPSTETGALNPAPGGGPANRAGRTASHPAARRAAAAHERRSRALDSVHVGFVAWRGAAWLGAVSRVGDDLAIAHDVSDVRARLREVVAKAPQAASLSRRRVPDPPPQPPPQRGRDRILESIAGFSSASTPKLMTATNSVGLWFGWSLLIGSR